MLPSGTGMVEMAATGAGIGTVTDPDLDLLCVNTIRSLCIDAIQKANSGHPGSPMGIAPVAYTLWQRLLRFDPEEPIWPNRTGYPTWRASASRRRRARCESHRY